MSMVAILPILLISLASGGKHRVDRRGDPSQGQNMEVALLWAEGTQPLTSSSQQDYNKYIEHLVARVMRKRNKKLKGNERGIPMTDIRMKKNSISGGGIPAIPNSIMPQSGQVLGIHKADPTKPTLKATPIPSTSPLDRNSHGIASREGEASGIYSGSTGIPSDAEKPTANPERDPDNQAEIPANPAAISQNLAAISQNPAGIPFNLGSFLGIPIAYPRTIRNPRHYARLANFHTISPRSGLSFSRGRIPISEIRMKKSQQVEFFGLSPQQLRQQQELVTRIQRRGDDRGIMEAGYGRDPPIMSDIRMKKSPGFGELEDYGRNSAWGASIPI